MKVSPRLKFALLLAGLFVLSLGVLALVGAALWAELAEHERRVVVRIVREHVGLLVFLALGLLLPLALVLRRVFERYVFPPLEFAEAAKIIFKANPSHRLRPHGSVELRELAQVINAFAEDHQALRRDVEARIRDAQVRLEEQRNRLAALISELTQSVLVCNAEGRILLYNPRAEQLLGHRTEAAASIGRASLVGLGRSVFAILERGLIAHALETVQARLDKGEPSPVASFVTTASGGQLIRVQLSPVLGPSEPALAAVAAAGGEGGPVPAAPVRRVNGFVLILEDVTAAVEAGSRKDVLLQSLTEGSRRALANMRAAVETLSAYPDMEPARRERFIRVIDEEAAGLSAKLEKTVGEYSASVKTEWLLEDMLGSDLVSAVGRRIESELGLRCELEAVDPAVWLKVDSYTLVHAVTCIAHRLRDEQGAGALRLGLQAAGRLAYLDLRWSGSAPGSHALASWEAQPLSLGGGAASPVSLAEVLERHDGELLFRADPGSGGASLRLLLPTVAPRRSAFRPPLAERGRPEYFDFDLFHQAGQTPELDQRKLSELTFTVFDTETTGLQPSGGDQIVAIGALRIVNGRLLHHEAFEQLIDPGRPMSPEAVRITGIDSSMLAGQPPIERVLPEFHKFCEDTVLVAHNAAFDMRFLQLNEQRTGVRFTQPVLDTLLLSAVVHPNLASGSLEAIAERFGIDVIGRHTAIGDAIMTGEAFLKMIPLLADKGILTLRDAREASQKTYYARVVY